ncbi:Predicted ATP-dependent endonuclease of the OLD family, contains P-loop ATPase and TOPRIM domains [Propionispira arboris]|uniref:Predicted ATP-dependent endonuclease of the OLD family, contains P-loop ATPase and TOPRIM domains n=1 Tax=Propionispira arboris TaxID=84035 RepID=A0A1H7AKS6_9FIRM|nr:AAA family ATPase [Propionispira arboris]SEJ66241.1 Predicted ATP-dependent endonuclease of the OLD family, contains P-loop ATPase and TOPRIM domains [Propionispira arboris]
MKLLKYCVTNFRSVENSGWIKCEDVTTLVGINESGKSNLLLALWKLNPARGGEIDILHDMPVSKLSRLRKLTYETSFISAEFELDEDSAAYISDTLKCDCRCGVTVVLTRFYDQHYSIEFPAGNPNPNKVEPDKDQDGVEVEEYSLEQLTTAIVHEIPKFVYYSNYGNLSSRIYLPYAINWLDGQTVPGVDVNEDQVRTLRVLFDFVHLEPQEILELGKDPKILAMGRNGNQVPTKEEIKKAEDDKEQRSILLQSAAGELTKEFKAWWKQGEYRFRFEADGDYFRIWVSDKIRTDEVGLELRSTGLQWFLSFYLIFLVESQEQHKNAILLLDEAGLTLHPLAQKDLCHFFDDLAQKNQIINTTHSPFIVDTSNIDRCRVVYLDKNGFTVASSNLRDGVGDLGNQSVYAVHAALGLSVSDILFQGCQEVVVEGVSDQYYLNAIKNYLIYKKLLAPKKDIVFLPAGGVKGVSGIVSLLGGKHGKLPYVILDSDKSGVDFKKKLAEHIYQNVTENLLEIKDYTNVENSEIEDLLPYSILEQGVNHLFLAVEDDSFVDVYNEEKPIVPQIQEFARINEIDLCSGWKVEIARGTKKVLLSKKVPAIIQKYEDMWVKLFKRIIDLS